VGETLLNYALEDFHTLQLLVEKLISQGDSIDNPDYLGNTALLNCVCT
jgi:hypothetical protein